MSYRLLGRKTVGLFLYPTVCYFYLFGKKQRKALSDYFDRLTSLPEGRTALGHSPTSRDVFRILLEFARASVDKFASWSGEITDVNAVWNNSEVILSLARKGKGGIILGAHLGNIEAIRALAQNHPFLKVNALMFIENSERYNRILSEAHPEVFHRVILTNHIGPDTVIELQHRINNGEFIAILADRVADGSSGRSVRVPFLGKVASFPKGPFILAKLLNAPVFTIFCFRRSFSSYEVFIDQFSDQISFPRERRNEAVQEVVRQYARVLEKHCFLAPHQWFNFFDFWSKDPT